MQFNEAVSREESNRAAQSVSPEEFRQVVRLVADAGDPSETNVIERRRKLGAGLAKLIDADIFFWVVGVANLDDPGAAIPTMSVDGGWKDDDERLRVMQMSTTCPEVLALYARITEYTSARMSATVLRVDLVSDEEWRTLGEPIRQLGISDLIFSHVSLTEVGHSTLGLHRRFSKPAYGERERFLVDMVFQNIAWIHRPGLQLDAGRIGAGLTGRQREVLTLLFQGCSNKMIASRMNVQLNTVGEHMKNIFKRFGVNSRTELLAKFISGLGPREVGMG